MIETNNLIPTYDKSSIPIDYETLLWYDQPIIWAGRNGDNLIIGLMLDFEANHSQEFNIIVTADQFYGYLTGNVDLLSIFRNGKIYLYDMKDMDTKIYSMSYRAISKDDLPEEGAFCDDLDSTLRELLYTWLDKYL